MKVNLSLNIAEVEKSLNKTKAEIRAIVEKSLMKTAQYGTQIILDRTEKGVGYLGKFAPYSPAYRKAKAAGWKATPRRRGFGGDSSGVVNLNVSGSMLSSIQQRALNQDTVQIYFGRATEAKKAAFNNERRPFFGFNDKEQEALSKFFFREFQK
jgi:hypothetical protein